MSQFINSKIYKFISNTNEPMELKDDNGFYTGEIVDKYTDISELRAVINRGKGNLKSEQFGTLYKYDASLQHKGKPILKINDLVWVDSTSDLPDMIVREVVPSLSSTKYYLDYKVTDE